MEAQLGCGDSGFVPVVKHACIVDRAMNTTTTTTTIPTTTSEGCMHACSTRDNTHARILMCLYVTYLLLVDMVLIRRTQATLQLPICRLLADGWRQRKHLAQLRTGSHWLAVCNNSIIIVETGRYGNARVERAQRSTVSAL